MTDSTLNPHQISKQITTENDKNNYNNINTKALVSSFLACEERIEM